MNRYLQGFLMVSACLVAAACSTPKVKPPTAPQSVTYGAFPYTPELQPQVDFWRHVYGVWSISKVALHDNKHLDLVYEVIQLPGPVTDGYTESQRQYVRARQQVWKDRLAALEDKVMTGAPLSPSEQELASYITARAGAVAGASDRLHSQRGLRERFKRGLEISGRYDALFRDIFRQAGLPEDLAYLPHVESSFQNHAHSSAGAVGVWQFTKPAARIYLNMGPALDERRDPVASARGAARYLRDAHDDLGNWALAITSYNHGVGGMKRAQQYYGNDFAKIVRNYNHPNFGFASRNFYTEFLAAREVAKNAHRYFPEGVRYEAPLNWDRVVLQQPASASTIAQQFGLTTYQLTALNSAWTDAAHTDQATLPPGAEVWLPPGTLARNKAVIGLNGNTLAMIPRRPPAQP